jgi:hypothetical protein
LAVGGFWNLGSIIIADPFYWKIALETANRQRPTNTDMMSEPSPMALRLNGKPKITSHAERKHKGTDGEYLPDY